MRISGNHKSDPIRPHFFNDRWIPSAANQCNAYRVFVFTSILT